MKQKVRRRTLLGAGFAAVLLLSPVFWLLPGRGMTVKNVSVQTLPYPYWTIDTSYGPEAVYVYHGHFSFEHRSYYMTRDICCGALLIHIRGRSIPDMYE